jgi:hypothetical protein
MKLSLPNKVDTDKAGSLGIFELLLFSSTVGCLLHYVYFLLAPSIWATRPILPLGEYTLWMRGYVLEHDGVEVYALYFLMFLNLATVSAVTNLFGRIVDRTKRCIALVLMLIVTCYYYYSLGFNPPVNSLRAESSGSQIWQISCVVLLVMTATSLLYFMQTHLRRFLPWIAVLVLIPICFIAIQPLSLPDVSYIFSPALRLLYGVRIPEIYFQYDLFLSFIAALWMKLNFPLASFTILGQFSYYLLILGTFLFARKYFLDQRLPVFLLVGMVLIRIYGMSVDPVRVFQVTPLRLDLWFPLLLLIYVYGAYHWSVGLFFSLLLLFHRNFGIIYAASYCQLLLTIYGVECLKSHTGVSSNWRSKFKTQVDKCKYNLLLISVSFVANTIFFKDVSSKSENLYQNIGVGFIKISSNTFYWYLIILVSLVFLLLVRFREIIPHNYLSTSFMLVFLAIGNSIYFFGRSHDHNIINISAVFVLLFFVLLDLLSTYSFKHCDRHTHDYISKVPIAAAFIFILLASVYYGKNIHDKVSLQFNNVKQAKIIYPLEADTSRLASNISYVKEFTHNSNKVYFFSFNDFLYYYFGHYAPVGYFSPCESWLLNRTMLDFLTDLVNRGYYLVIEDFSVAAEIVPFIPNKKLADKDGFVIVWKD